MDKKALIAIGVIAVLGVATYAIIVAKNAPKTTGSTYIPNTTTTPASNSSNSNTTYVTLADAALCKFFKIGCPPDTTNSSTPSTAIS
jgi:hypothetical protein